MMDHGFALRAPVLHCLDDPTQAGDRAWEYYPDGLLWVQGGRIQRLEHASAAAMAELPAGVAVEALPDRLIIPGLVDAHIHYPQTEMIAAYGGKLLDWLNTYTFPVEAKFGDAGYASAMARFFLRELLRNGTTTALVFGTVHPTSVSALFQAAHELNLRLIAGKVLMDRNAPEALCDSAETGYQESVALIERWHRVGRLGYAVTPRFAPTSSPRQLRKIGELLREYPDVYLHTHLAESREEVAWVQQLFPDARHYLDVYDRYGLVGERSLFAHGIHLCDDACQRLGQAGSGVVHCPTSNLFLGSGLLNLQRLRGYGVKLAVGTDVGAGTSFSLFRTLDEAYKVQQLQGLSLSPMQGLYLATLGGARALGMGHLIGSLQPGREADFLVLDPAATPLLALRMARCRDIVEQVFVLNTLADDRVVQRTYAAGRCLYRRGEPEAA